MAAFNIGCGDDGPDSLAEAAKEINSSKSGLVQVAENSGSRVVVQYLTPEYLAWAEVQNKDDKRSMDSLVALYRKGLSFHVSMTSPTDNEIEVPALEEGLVAREGGVVNVEASNGMFFLEAEGKTWSPVYTHPELRAGVSGKTWLVVFAIDPYREFSGKKTVTLIHTDPDRNDTSQFTYNVVDLLRSEIIASNN